MKKLKVIWDMESGDPDDFVTLLLLLGHPQVDLRAVTVTPGGADQIGLVKWALCQFGVEDQVQVGGFWNPLALENSDLHQFGSIKSRVSAWHYRTYGKISKCYEAELGWKVLKNTLNSETTMITGGPLKNLGALLSEDQTSDHLGRLFVQGGFAGDNVVPVEYRLPKFEGKITCPTYNLNGAPKAALKVIESDRFSEKRFISKNVCHGVSYTQKLHEQFQKALLHAQPDSAWEQSLKLIEKGMGAYLKKHPMGKKLHDPLAACCALNVAIGQWVEVILYRQKGEWGAQVSPDSGCWIIIAYDQNEFEKTLLAQK